MISRNYVVQKYDLCFYYVVVHIKKKTQTRKVPYNVNSKNFKFWMTSTQAIQDILKKGGSKKVQQFCRPFFKLGKSVFQVFAKLYKDLICKNFPRRWQKFEKKFLRPFSKNILTPQILMNIWRRRRR